MKKVVFAIAVAASPIVWVAGCGSSSGQNPVPCTTDDECGLGEYCVDGFCRPIGGDQQPDTCKNDTDCREGWYCDQGVCTEGSRPDAGEPDAGADGDDGGGETQADEPQPEPEIELGGDVVAIQDEQGVVYEINFGSVTYGQTVEASLVVRNMGDADLEISVVTISDDPNDEFAISPQVPPEQVIEPQGRLEFTVSYRAADALTDVARAQIFSNDPDEGQLEVRLVSEFKGQPRLQIDPQQLDFGEVPVGQQVEKRLDITNAGTGNAVLVIDAVEPEPGIAAAYGVVLEDLSQNPVALPAYVNRGDVLTAKVTFLAPARGRYDGNLVITSNDDVGPVQVPLSAGCGIPALEVDPQSVDFGPVAIGDTARKTVTLTNSGTGPLTVESITLAAGSSSEFVLENLPSPLPAQPLLVQPQASAQFDIAYSPAQEAAAMATVLIAHDAPEPGQQQQLLVSGQGFVGNQPPVAVILANGQDTDRLDAMLGETLQLDGSRSTDGDGTVTGWQWEVVSQPPTRCGSPITIPAAGSQQTSVQLSEAGLVKIGLTVTDDRGAQSNPDVLDVMVHAKPTARIKTGGNDTGFVSVNLGAQVTFDALLSEDCDGNVTGYQWQFVQYPPGRGSAPSIGGGQEYATVTFDFPGQYRLELVVTDDDTPQNQSDPAYFDIEVRGPKAFRLELHVFDLGDEDHKVDVDMHLLQPGGGTGDFGTELDCCPDKDGVDQCNPTPDWGVYGNPVYARDVWEDPDGLGLPSPGNPQDEIQFDSPGMGQYPLYVMLRCHSSSGLGGYLCCEDMMSLVCPWTPWCIDPNTNENKCGRQAQGVVRFYVTGHDGVEQWVADKNFAFASDSGKGDFILIGTILWPQGLLQ